MDKKPSFAEMLAKVPLHEHVTDIEVSDGVKMKASLIDSIYYPTLCSEKRFAELRDFKIRDDDVFLVTYPKTGSHWAHSILTKLLNVPSNQMIILDFNLPLFTIPDLDAMPSPRVLPMHIEAGRMPAQLLNSKAKIVYTSRNPKDTAVSFYHHLTQMPGPLKFTGTWNDAFKWFFDSKCVFYTGQLPHMKSWIDLFKKQEDRFFNFVFEDMKRDPRSSMQKLAAFLGTGTDQEKLEQVIKETEFKNMKAAVEKKPGSLSFIFRKGEIGDWKNMFTVAQSEQVDVWLDSVKDTYDFEFIFTSK